MSLNGPAAARLYDDHVDMVYGYVARRLGPEASSDVVAAVFEQALATYDRFVDSKSSQRGWLLGLATNAIRLRWPIERQRLQSWAALARPQSPGATGDPLLASNADNTPDPDIVAAMSAVAELDPLDRDILLLVGWERCEPGVVADALDISTNDVRTGLRRARKNLKRIAAAQRQHAGFEASPGAENDENDESGDNDEPEPTA